MGRPINRAPAHLPVGAMQTYAILAPRSTHYRRATCAEFECPDYVNGFALVADLATDLGQAQATYIRGDRTRSHREDRELMPGSIVFRFPPGTQPFAGAKHDHFLPLERPEIFLKRGGDWRADTGIMRRFDRPDQWVDDFAEHQQRVKNIFEKG